MFESTGCHQTGEIFENPLRKNVFEKPAQVLFDGMNNYTDHLGNVRLSYSMDHLTGKLKILEENQYYPFGLRHEVYVSGTKLDFSRNPGDGIEPEPGLPPVLDYVTRMEYQYKYNGKEFQDELGLNVYDFGARMYMPDIGRWGVHDPASEYMVEWSPYAYAYNDPVAFVDEDGEMPGPTGFVLGVLSDYIGQVGYNYFYSGYDLTTSMTTDINYWSLGISGLTGAATGGISSIKNVVSSGVGKKIFVKMIDYGIDVLVNTIENTMSDQLNEGDYDFWKSLTGGLIEAGIGKVIPMKYVDKLENKLMRKMNVSANKMNKYKNRMADKNRSKKTRQRNKKKYQVTKKEHDSYKKAYQGVKTVNDAFKAGGTSALTDSLFKKDPAPAEDSPKGTVSAGELEIIGIE